MDYPFLSHHGATRGVTGSCHQLHLDPAISLLVDCGLQQGSDAIDGVAESLDFAIQGVRALVVTHVHLDHVGRIPRLLSKGFAGPIYCSEPSARLLPLVLEDAFRLTVSNEPAHVARYLARIAERIVPLPFGVWRDVVDESGLRCRIRLQRAGHLLGSAYVECDLAVGGRNHRILFSGDLGAGSNPLLRPLQPPERADLLVLESTYGDRLHPLPGNRQGQLEASVDRALQDSGTLLIPAFSLGRTQELLYELEAILHQKMLLGDPAITPDDASFTWSRLPIILDSPLAQRITAAYRQLHDFWSEEALALIGQGRDPLGFDQLICVDSHARHQQVVNYLRSTGRPAIVIAGNGMCSGGRIVNYLKAMLGDPRHEVMFVGYQARGTPGALIQAAERAREPVMVDLEGERCEIRAKVKTLAGYSGHADQSGLVDFALRSEARQIVLVHGEARAKQALARVLRQRFAEMRREANVTIA